MCYNKKHPVPAEQVRTLSEFNYIMFWVQREIMNMSACVYFHDHTLVLFKHVSEHYNTHICAHMYTQHTHLSVTACLCLGVWLLSCSDGGRGGGGGSADLCIFAGLGLAVAQKPSRWTAEKAHWFHPSRNPFSQFPPPYPALHLIKHLQGAMPTQFVIYQK